MNYLGKGRRNRNGLLNMKKVKKWRYYCDFCKKAGNSAFHIGKHEKGCTKNPNRICGLCNITDNIQKPLSELVTVLQIEDGQIKGMEQLREIVNNCPACILATLRQVTKNLNAEEYWKLKKPEFSFKSELEEFWKDYNDNNVRDYY